MDSWLTNARDALAAPAQLEPQQLDLSDADVRTLLDLARMAAHESGERTNAPMLSYLLGRAQGQRRDLEPLAAGIRTSTS